MTSPKGGRDEGAIPRYSANVLLGNWYEDVYKKQEELLNFVNAMKSGELMHQHAGKFYSKQEQAVTTSPEKPNVAYGDRIMIVNPHLHAKQPKDEAKQYAGLSVSVVYRVEDYIRSPEIFPQQYLACSGDVLPSMRNTFCIGSVDGKNKEGDDLCYGEHFTLSPTSSYGNRPLYVESLPPHFSVPIGYAEKVKVSLVPYYSVYCRWNIQNVDPGSRTISNFKPVPANTNLIIAHSSTNQTLCALDYWFPTIFGNECELTIEKRENKFHRPMESNVWQFRNSVQSGVWYQYKEQVENRKKKEHRSETDTEMGCKKPSENSPNPNGSQ